MNASPRSVHDVLRELEEELRTTRAIAQLMLHRLAREPDDYGREKNACQVTIEQTRLIEQAVEQITAESAQPYHPAGHVPVLSTTALDVASAGGLGASRRRGRVRGEGQRRSCLGETGQRLGAGDTERIPPGVPRGGACHGLTTWHATAEILMDAHDFTPTERRVARELLKARTNKEIAQTLGVSENTVKSHLTAMFGKTYATSRVGLVLTLLGQMDEPVTSLAGWGRGGDGANGDM